MRIVMTVALLAGVGLAAEWPVFRGNPGQPGVAAGKLLTVWAACLYVTAVLCATLLPLHIATGTYSNQAAWFTKANFVPVLTIDGGHFALNMTLAIPLGLLMPLLARHEGIRTVAFAGFCLSALVFTLEFVTNVLLSSGMTANINNLIAGTAGATLGVLLARGLLTIRQIDRVAEPWRLEPAFLPARR